jgi:hypothetical protein
MSYNNQCLIGLLSDSMVDNMALFGRYCCHRIGPLDLVGMVTDYYDYLYMWR